MLVRRVILGAGSVALPAIAIGMALAFGPVSGRALLLLCGVLAVALIAKSAVMDPADIIPALLLALPPVAALAADGSPGWLIGPLATVLLVGAELNVIGWRLRGSRPLSMVQKRRLGDLATLGLLAMTATLATAAVMLGR